MTAPTLTGQQSLERICAGHPLALARLKELMLAEARYRWLRNQVNHADFIPIAQCVWKRNSNPHEIWVNLANGANLDAAIDKAIAEGGQ